MKKIKITLIVLLGIIAVASCEKDDICIEGDTPLLTIDFYDIADTTALKDVPTLVVRGISENSVHPIIANKSLNSIEIPLRSNATTTSFILSENLTPDDTTSVNRDTITFNYETKELFVSRACGFIANYDGLQGALTESDTAQWVKEIKIMTSLVKNDTLTNVKIFH